MALLFAGLGLRTERSAPQPNSDSNYLDWLEQRSMLYQARQVANEVSGHGAQWRHPYGEPQPREAVRHAGHIKGILAQKPLAMTFHEAKECVDLCARASVVLAVNQNMRYDQSVRALKDLLRRGWLGEIVLATIDMRAIPHWMPWSAALPSLSTFVMSIHHLDRFWRESP